ANSGHASSGLLNVYFLCHDGAQWKVLRRHENIAALGSFGRVGSAEWVTLASNKPGLAMLHGGIWQGYQITLLDLFDLGSRDIRNLTDESINIHSENDGACGPDTEECWNISGKWHFSPGKPDSPYGDLVVEFTGERLRL